MGSFYLILMVIIFQFNIDFIVNDIVLPLMVLLPLLLLVGWVRRHHLL